MELRGARVLITGASRGIGEALAREVAALGASTALVARSSDAIRALATELGGTAHPADLADPEQVATLIHRVEDEAGPVDVLVNNAALSPSNALAAMDPQVVRDVYQVNLITPTELCRQAIPRMLRRGKGHIVNVSSLAGVVAIPGTAVYSTTKAALTHLTASLRADLKGTPVSTTVVELGPVPTDILDDTLAYPPTARAFKRSYRLRLIVDVTPDVVAKQIASAIEKGHRHVRIPKRATAFSLLAEAPRRIGEIILTGVKAQR